ncbi:MAG: hypothetical protein ACRBBM_18180 [Pseudomonadaceae bacterium]
MSNSKTVSSSGPGLAVLVFIVFLTLKLAEIGAVATWSWWWVTSPLWISAGLVLGVVSVILAIGGVAYLAKRRSRRGW